MGIETGLAERKVICLHISRLQVHLSRLKGFHLGKGLLAEPIRMLIGRVQISQFRFVSDLLCFWSKSLLRQQVFTWVLEFLPPCGRSRWNSWLMPHLVVVTIWKGKQHAEDHSLSMSLLLVHPQKYKNEKMHDKGLCLPESVSSSHIYLLCFYAITWTSRGTQFCPINACFLPIVQQAD